MILWWLYDDFMMMYTCEFMMTLGWLYDEMHYVWLYDAFMMMTLCYLYDDYDNVSSIYTFGFMKTLWCLHDGAYVLFYDDFTVTLWCLWWYTRGDDEFLMMSVWNDTIPYILLYN